MCFHKKIRKLNWKKYDCPFYNYSQWFWVIVWMDSEALMIIIMIKIFYEIRIKPKCFKSKSPYQGINALMKCMHWSTKVFFFFFFFFSYLNHLLAGYISMCLSSYRSYVFTWVTGSLNRWCRSKSASSHRWHLVGLGGRQSQVWASWAMTHTRSQLTLSYVYLPMYGEMCRTTRERIIFD